MDQEFKKTKKANASKGGKNDKGDKNVSHQTNRPRNKTTELLIAAAAILLLVLAVFFQTRNFGFLNFDDNQYIQEIPAVQNGLKWDSIVWAWTNSHVGQWHPLTTMSFMLDSELGALKTGSGFHLQNVFHQALASVMLLFALHSLTGSVWRSAIAAAIFAIHPLRAESVAWVTERKDVLSGVFLMACLWAYSFYTKKTESTARYILVCVLFALGLLSKPMLVSLPFVFLLLDFWPLNRINWDKIPATGREWFEFLAKLWPLVREKTPIFVMAFASAIGAIIAVGHPFRPIPILDLIPRLKYIPLSYTKYVWQFFVPTHLAAHYPFVPQGPEDWKVVFCLAFLGFVSWHAWRSRARYPYFLVGWLWFLGTMLPVIGLVPGGIQIIADRYTYLTQIGISVALVWAINDWIDRDVLPITKVGAGIVAQTVIFALAIACHEQAKHWATDKSLWSHALAVTKNNDYASEKMATALQAEGDRDGAERLYRQAITLNPRLVGSLNNLSILLRSKGEVEEAIKLQTMAAKEHPTWSLMWRNLGSAYAQAQKPEEARKAFEEAIRLEPRDLESAFNVGLILSEMMGKQENLEEAISIFNRLTTAEPRFADGYFNKGNCFYRLNRMDEAVQAYQMAIQANPNHAKAYNNIGSILLSRNQFKESLPYFSKAIELDASYPDPLRNLAEASMRLGAFDNAIQAWRRQIEQNPNDAQSMFRLAWILATCPDGNVRRPFEARQVSQKGVELTQGKEAVFLDCLGAAQAQLGNFKEAEQAAIKALELFANNQQAAAAVQKRIDLYRSQQAYTDPNLAPQGQQPPQQSTPAKPTDPPAKPAEALQPAQSEPQ